MLLYAPFTFLQLRSLYNDSSLISTELTVLSDRLFTNIDIDERLQKKRQISDIRYLLLAPVIFTVNIMNRAMSAENVTQMIRNVDISINEIIGFNSVGMCTYVC